MDPRIDEDDPETRLTRFAGQQWQRLIRDGGAPTYRAALSVEGTQPVVSEKGSTPSGSGEGVPRDSGPRPRGALKDGFAWLKTIALLHKDGHRGGDRMQPKYVFLSLQ